MDDDLSRYEVIDSKLYFQGKKVVGIIHGEGDERTVTYDKETDTAEVIEGKIVITKGIKKEI